VDTAAQVEDVLRTQQASLAGAGAADAGGGGGAGPAAPAGSSECRLVLQAVDIHAVLDALLEPLLEVCRAGGDGLRVADTAVYLLNNISALTSVLTPYPFTAGWVQRLASETAVWEDALVHQASNDVLQRCGLLAKLSSLRTVAPPAVAAMLPGLTLTDLRPSVQAFYAELTAPSFIAMFDRVANPRVRSRVRRETAAVLAAAYARLVEAVRGATAGYTAADVAVMLPQSPEQVEVLLDLR
jgi:hypothetical protein